MEIKKLPLIVIISFIFGALGGTAASYSIFHLPPSNDQLIREYYAAESEVRVSPQTLIADFAQGKQSYLIVDLRSKEAYALSHIKGAINIPGNDEVAKVIYEFSKLPNERPIITYCYSEHCSLATKVGNILAQNSIYVKHLSIGWAEWNQTAKGLYIESGSSP